MTGENHTHWPQKHLYLFPDFLFASFDPCDTMWLFVELGVCVCQSENLLVCFGAKPTQSTENEISRETGSGGEKEVQEKTEEQLTKEDGNMQSTTESRKRSSSV